MAKKTRRGHHLAVGYWGRDPHCRIQQEGIPDKIKVLLQEALIAMGRPVELWLPVNDNTPSTFACTCDKDTRPGSDFRCLSCYGMRRVPGYLRFQHDTVFFSTAIVEVATYTLVTIERDTTIKPNRLRLTAAALTGTVETGDKAFTNPDDVDWEFEVAAYRKTATDVILAEFSTDAGATYTDVTLINGVNKPTGTGAIRFRITLTRAAVTTDSPDFEIVRMRRRKEEDQTDFVKVRDDLLPGQILVLRTWQIERALRNMNLGRQIDLSADKAWTAPLDFFSLAVSPDTPAARIQDRQAGPHPFYEHAFGVQQGDRYPTYQNSISEQLLTFTHQAFFDRRAQSGEIYTLVF